MEKLVMLMIWSFFFLAVVRSTSNMVPSNPPVEAPAPPTPVDCSTLIYQMADCLGYLLDGSNDTKPDYSCCSGFDIVRETDSGCICEALMSSADMGFDINMTKAMSLPIACASLSGKSHALVSPITCQASGSPRLSPSAAAPSTEAASPTANTGAMPSTTTGTKPISTPAPAPHKADGSFSAAVSFSLLATMSMLAFICV